MLYGLENKFKVLLTVYKFVFKYWYKFINVKFSWKYSVVGDFLFNIFIRILFLEINRLLKKYCIFLEKFLY